MRQSLVELVSVGRVWNSEATSYKTESRLRSRLDLVAIRLPIPHGRRRKVGRRLPSNVPSGVKELSRDQGDPC
jgi:hypothetical protein